MQNTIGHFELLPSSRALTSSLTPNAISQALESSALFSKTAFKTKLLAVPDETKCEESPKQRKIPNLSFSELENNVKAHSQKTAYGRGKIKVIHKN